MGYSNFETKEWIAPDEQLEVKYYIVKLNYSDYEIVVYGKAEEKEVSRRQLTPEIKKIPGLGGDAIRWYRLCLEWPDQLVFRCGCGSWGTNLGFRFYLD